MSERAPVAGVCDAVMEALDANVELNGPFWIDKLNALVLAAHPKMRKASIIVAAQYIARVEGLIEEPTSHISKRAWTLIGTLEDWQAVRLTQRGASDRWVSSWGKRDSADSET
jgi:hypothetical protein